MRSKNSKVIAVNKRALHDYEVLEKIEAGIKLVGSEVKAVRNGNVNLRGSYVTLHETGKTPLLHVINLHIGKYEPAGPGQHEFTRTREILVKHKEREKLAAFMQEKGKTVVPLELCLAHGLIKVTLAVVQSKKLHDKRSTIKERDIKRKMQQEMRQKVK
jgi:SsrA-binding protein